MADHGQLRVDAGLQRFGLQCVLGLLARRQLIVDAPDAVRLAVHQDGVAGVPGGVEEGQPLGGEGQVDVDVGDDEQALVRGAFHLQLQAFADAGAATIGGDQPVGGQHVFAFGRVDGDDGVVALLRHLHHLVAPAEVDQPAGGAGVDQVFLHVLLLDVQHGKEAVVGAVRRLHAKHRLTLVNRVAEAPGQAVLGHALGGAHLLQDLHRAAREHDGAAALRHLELGRDQHAGHAMARQLQRGHHARGAGAGDHHLVARLRAVLRGQPGRMHAVVVIDRRARLGRRLVHRVSWGCAPRRRRLCKDALLFL